MLRYEKEELKMEKINPIYKKLLIIAIVIYVTATSIMLSDMCRRIGEIEHTLTHMQAGHMYKH